MRIIAKRETKIMTSQSSVSGGATAQKSTPPTIVLLTAKEAAKLYKQRSSSLKNHPPWQR